MSDIHIIPAAAAVLLAGMLAGGLLYAFFIKDTYTKIEKGTSIVKKCRDNLVLCVLWGLGAFGLVYILYQTFCGGTAGIAKATSLAPAGILLAAFIASASVMKSIESAKELHRRKEKDERDAALIYLLHTLEDCVEHLNTVIQTLEVPDRYSYEDRKNLTRNAVDTSKLIETKESFYALPTHADRKLLMSVITLLLGFVTFDDSREDSELADHCNETIETSLELLKIINKTTPL